MCSNEYAIFKNLIKILKMFVDWIIIYLIKRIHKVFYYNAKNNKNKAGLTS